MVCHYGKQAGSSSKKKKSHKEGLEGWFSWWEPVMPTGRPEFQFSVLVYKARSCSVCLWLCSGQKRSDPWSSLASQPDSVVNSKFSESPYLKTAKAESIWGNTQCWPLASTSMNWPLQAWHTETRLCLILFVGEVHHEWSNPGVKTKEGSSLRT